MSDTQKKKYSLVLVNPALNSAIYDNPYKAEALGKNIFGVYCHAQADGESVLIQPKTRFGSCCINIDTDKKKVVMYIDLVCTEDELDKIKRYLGAKSGSIVSMPLGDVLSKRKIGLSDLD